jgi:hypothetical protein
MNHHGMAYVAMPAGMMALYAPAGGIVYAAPPPARYQCYRFVSVFPPLSCLMRPA